MSRDAVRAPAGEFQRQIGRYQDMALTQPVALAAGLRTIERASVPSIRERVTRFPLIDFFKLAGPIVE